MLVNVWRFIALMFATLTTGMGLRHLMELPARLDWDQSLWVNATVVGGLYRMFGLVGGPVVLATVITTVALAFLVRRRGSCSRSSASLLSCSP